MTNLQIGDRVCQVYNATTERVGTVVALGFWGWDVGVRWDTSSLVLGYRADELGLDHPPHTRGMCCDCDTARCDVNPSACDIVKRDTQRGGMNDEQVHSA